MNARVRGELVVFRAQPWSADIFGNVLPFVGASPAVPFLVKY